MRARIGRYEMLERIATGGMGTIYRARRLGPAGFCKIVAIKSLAPHLTWDSEARHMFLDEARILAQLDHRNIVQVFDAIEDGEGLYMALEFVDGPNLYTVLKTLSQRGMRMPLPLAVHVVREIAAGLHYAHTRRAEDGTPLDIVHRDISPQNILLSRAGDVKVVDFGIVKAIRRSTHTRHGMIKGKAGYMAPEQVMGEPVDARTDVFAAGIVLHELITCRPLFLGGSEDAMLRAACEGPIRSPRDVCSDIPPTLERIVLRALARDPDRRYASALQLHDALAGFMALSRRAVGGVELGRFIRSLESEETDWAPSEAVAHRSKAEDIARRRNRIAHQRRLIRLARAASVALFVGSAGLLAAILAFWLSG